MQNVNCRELRSGKRWTATMASVALFAAAGPAAAPVGAETLRQAMAGAYKYNPRLDAERARLRATDEEVPRALSGYRPTVTGTADVAYQRQETKPSSPNDGEIHPHGYAVNASQPIFRGFRTINQVREAEATVRAGRETLRVTEQSVLLEAVTAYMDVVRDQAIVRLRENNVTVLTRELRATEERFKVGEVTRTDVAQATARRAGAVSTLDLAKANLKTSRATYERVVGNPPSNLVDPPPPEKLLPKSASEAIGISTKENPNVVAALYREQASRHTVDRIWGELLPEVRVDASYTKRFDPSRSTDESESTSVVGRLSVPIYQGGEVHARVRQAKHTHVSRLQEIEQARTETQATVVAAFSRLEASRAQLISDLAQVDANQTALAGVREEERVGQRTLLDVLNAEQELLNSQVQLATTKRDVIVNSYNLLASVGRLSANEMSLASNVYDPQAHYHEVRRKWWGVSITHRDGRHEFLDLWHTHGTRHEPVK